jgi:hypothetical protein
MREQYVAVLTWHSLLADPRPDLSVQAGDSLLTLRNY